jgi:hypothetical protein
MADLSIILARNTRTAPLAPLEQPCAALARQKRKNLTPIPSESRPYSNADPMPQLDLHFIYTLTNKNGRLGAKRTLQATDEYWSCLVDRSA